MNGPTDEQGSIRELAATVGGATGWMKFLGGFYVVGAVFGALAGVLLLVFAAAMENIAGLEDQLPGMGSGYFTAVGVFTLAAIGIYAWLGVLLWQSASAFREAQTHGNRNALAGALAKMRTFFVALGVVTVVALVMGIVFSIISFNSLPPPDGIRF